MPVLQRDALAESPLADLHLLASELGIDGFRRLRKDDLIDAILARQGGEAGGEEDAGDEAEAAGAAAAQAGAPDEATTAGETADAAAAQAEAPDEATTLALAGEDEEEEEEEPETEEEAREAETAEAPPPRGRRRRGSRRRRSADEDREAEEVPEEEAREAETAEAPPVEGAVDGVVEVLGNGSAFVRVAGPEASEGDVYVSAAQVRRCELVSGDRITGPARPPRRSERYPSLVRVETINGRPADEVAEGTRWEDLPAAFPSERFALEGDDPTLQAVRWLTPFGKGSRVVLAGPARAGKTEALRRIAAALPEDGLERVLVLLGVRPEEIAEWAEPVEPVAALHLGIAPDAQAAALERAVEQARRVASRGGDAVLLVDSLDGAPPAAARRALAAARSIPDGGSLTVIATAAAPLGGETTVIALDPALTAARSFPALDLAASGTLRPEALVGDAGAEAIARAHVEAAAPAVPA